MKHSNHEFLVSNEPENYFVCLQGRTFGVLPVHHVLPVVSTKTECSSLQHEYMIRKRFVMLDDELRKHLKTTEIMLDDELRKHLKTTEIKRCL
jgi:hypothetical protein